MKRFLLICLMALVFTIPSMTQAFDEFPCQPKAMATDNRILAFPAITLDGVAVWMPDVEGVAAGGLTNLAELYGFIDMSVLVAATFTEIDDSNTGVMVGPSLGVNIPKLVRKLGGTWLSDSIASSVGVATLYDVSDNKFRVGIYGSLIRINMEPTLKKLGLW